jgi:hypothetical protein
LVPKQEYSSRKIERNEVAIQGKASYEWNYPTDDDEQKKRSPKSLIVPKGVPKSPVPNPTPNRPRCYSNRRPQHKSIDD